MKEKVLEVLKSSDEFLSGEKIAEHFNMTRSGIWKYINMLKEDGYKIESVPRKGYRLVSSPDILSYPEIEEYLNTEKIGRNILYFDSIDSTNLKAKELAFELEEGSVIIAEEQSLGRGRMGRNWASPKKRGLWMTIILKPNIEPMKVGKITLLGAAALAKALNKMDIKAEIKWPNDILINRKKISGILTEMNCELNLVNYIIMGMGINVNLELEDIPEEIRHKASSIKIEEGRKINRQKLAGEILNEFELLYKDFIKTGDIKNTIKINKEYSAFLGQNIRVIKNKEELEAKALDINAEGELVVEYKDGTRENIFSGEVSIRGLNGYI